jgi:lipid II:glycine glycyltransferase (peptidoglycan interpeptide bridge formation enzyme)
MPEITPSQWDDFLSKHPDAHILQTRAWGDLKSEFGWSAARIVIDSRTQDSHVPIGSQILFRPVPFGLSFAYIPKGPVGCGESLGEFSNSAKFWGEVDALCQKRNAVFLKVEPDLWEPPEDEVDRSNHDVAPPAGFHQSFQEIQPPRTLLVDLRGSEEHILARMKQKTRYNVRLALKKGVVVHRSSDMDTFDRLMKITGERDSFGVHSQQYYQRAYDLFNPKGECEMLVAEFQGEPLAAIMVFARGKRAWYFYGASASSHRQRMPTYILQWEGMRWARERGCTIYDLWGVPDLDLHALDAEFTKRSGGLWGVYRFKRGFGGQLIRAYGPWDRVYQPIFYIFYHLWAKIRARDVQ